MSTSNPPVPGTEPLRPPRTISDEFRTLQSTVDLFQRQLDSPSGTINLHPFGPVNTAQTHTTFVQSCNRLRSSLLAYRDTTLASWGQLLAASMQHPDTHTAIASKRARVAVQELGEMHKVTDALYEDISGCQKILFDAAGDAISRTVVGAKSPTLLAERLRACAKRLGLAHYTDVQRRDDIEITTVTLAGGISVIDVDIGPRWDHMHVKISVSDVTHDSRIDSLMLKRLQTGDIHGFETMVEELAQLDRLTQTKSPVNFIHNTFAVAMTLAEIQKQELEALDGDIMRVLKCGSGVVLPYVRHVGPSTLYFMPAVVQHGLSDEDWARIKSNTMHEVTQLPGCLWLDFAWELSNKQHCFLSEQVEQYCVSADHMADDSGPFSVVSHQHPLIHNLELQFLETSDSKPQDQNADYWIPYTLVARVSPALPSCALTVRAVMAATGQSDTSSVSQDSPRLLEDAPTLERLVCANTARIVHNVGPTKMQINMEAPQIRAWSICRVPIAHVREIVEVVSLLRRQAVFNELLGSCVGITTVDCESMETGASVTVKTFANDPFRIDMYVQAEQTGVSMGVVLRVSEDSCILAWTHQALGVSDSDLTDMSNIPAASLTKATSHAVLSKAAAISSSIPIIVHWLLTH
ncbi:hypothetical protein GGF48_002093 [Coemansia sp. RSA 921]|nr:hypothetical protein GGF48_002093 [Coemansia sp. RSA 921]